MNSNDTKKIKNNIDALFANVDRTKSVGGSEVAAILGIDTFKTPYDVYLSKIESTEQEDTYIMQRGRFVEQFIADTFANVFGAQVIKPDAILRHQKYDFMTASPDRYFILNNETGILECKDTTKIISEIVPAHYVQVQWYLMLSNMTLGYVAYNTPYEFKTFKVKQNARFQEYLLTEVKNFWENYVLKHTPPPALNYDDIRRIYRDAVVRSSIQISDELRNVITQIKDIKTQIKKLETEQKEFETILLHYIEDNETLLDGDNIVATYKNVTTNRFDSKKFQKDNPELYEKYVNVSTSRRLVIK